jgi:hypothetical protein
VCHDSSDEDEFVDMLCAWVIRAITASPIECIRFCCDEFPTHSEAPRGFDALVEHLSRSNADTLRVLDLKGWLISAPSVSLLFGTSAALEELVTALDSDGFVCAGYILLFLLTNSNLALSRNSRTSYRR